MMGAKKKAGAVKQSARAALAGVPKSVRATERQPTAAERCKAVLRRIEAGELTGAACVAEGTTRRALYEWRDASPENSTAYARARELGIEVLAEDTIGIADDGSQDVRVLPDGRETPDYEFAARSRLRVDTRKWYVATVDPKRYGKQTNVDVTSGGEPITVVSGVPESAEMKS
jgi:hypothetical protein